MFGYITITIFCIMLILTFIDAQCVEQARKIRVSFCTLMGDNYTEQEKLDLLISSTIFQSILERKRKSFSRTYANDTIEIISELKEIGSLPKELQNVTTQDVICATR